MISGCFYSVPQFALDSFGDVDTLWKLFLFSLSSFKVYLLSSKSVIFVLRYCGCFCLREGRGREIERERERERNGRAAVLNTDCLLPVERQRAHIHCVCAVFTLPRFEL